MENIFWTAYSASMFAALATATGIFTIRHFNSWGRRNSIYFVCFAAGVLISVSILHLIPKSIDLNKINAPSYILLGYLMLHLLNRFITKFSNIMDDSNHKYSFGIISIIGIGFHSFIDGFIYSITFTANIFTGVITAIGMVLHEFPEGIITYMILLRAGFEEKKSLIFSLLAASISTPIGMLISYPFISNINKAFLGNLLSLSAGALLYIGATHLLPQVEGEYDMYSFLGLFSGVLVAVMTLFFE